MKLLAWFAVAMICATSAFAEVKQVAGSGSVPDVMDALEAAVNGAGATVFARVDHAAGAAKIGAELNDAQLLIFGNPALGTPAIQQAPLAGLYLPLRVLVYSDADEQTWLAYEDPADMLGDLGIDPDAEFVGKMQGALKNLTSAAAGI